MAKNKDSKDQQLTADQLLEARVDAMMDVRPDAPKPTPKSKPEPVSPAAPDELPPLDIFADSAGAPALPKKASGTKTAASSKVSADKPKEAAATEIEPPTSADADPAPADTEPAVPSSNANSGVSAKTELDDAKSDAAIDDIVAQEGDVVLAAEDAGIARAQDQAEAATTPKRSRHPIFWFLITLAVVAIIGMVIILTVPSVSNRFSN